MEDGCYSRQKVNTKKCLTRSPATGTLSLFLLNCAKITCAIMTNKEIGQKEERTMNTYTFVNNEGRVITVKADSQKEAIAIVKGN